MTKTHRAASLPSRRPLAQAVALTLACGAGATQAAIFNVTTSSDSGPGSLRQAVLDANASPGADQITFNPGLGAIGLTSGQLEITETLTITGPGAGQTIDAGGNSRILAVTADSESLTLENLTLSGGRTTAAGDSQPFTCAAGTGEGGAICALGDLTLTNSTVSGNSTTGDGAGGGGLFGHFGYLTLTNSTVSGNSTTGDGAPGGGIWSYGVPTLTNSTVSGNSTTGWGADGGGLRVKDAILANSTVSGNHTGGYDAPGGGLFVVSGSPILTNSTVSGNSTAGDLSSGGGLWVYGNVSLTNSTVSGNSTAGADAAGGGLFVDSWSLPEGNTLTNSTVTANQSAAGAGGVEITSHFGNDNLNLVSTILAANSGPGGNFNPRVGVTLNASNSLFGDDPAEIDGINIDNVFTNTPGLAPLADNGCAVPAGAPGSAACIHTHALLPGSLTLDAGANPLNLTTDERGGGFPRVLGAKADIGAFEGGGSAPATPTSIPALGAWGLALLSGLLGLFGLRFGVRPARRRE